MRATSSIRRLAVVGVAVLAVGGPSRAPTRALAAEARESGPCNEWIFSRERVRGATVPDAAGSLDATIEGPVVLERDPDALSLDGERNLVRVARSPSADVLPRRALSAEAWVLVLVPAEWGGIVGYLQDNGSFEKGWLLGTRGSRFSFAVASAGSDDGDGRVTYLAAPSAFEIGRYHHVAGTYDGRTMRVFVDGELAAESTEQSGDILYPPTGWYEIGAYHDDDELFPLRGAVARVRVWDRALEPPEVRAAFERERVSLPEPLRLETGPLVRYRGPGEVVISWSTADPVAAEVRYGRTAALDEQAGGGGARTRHDVLLSGLDRDRDYFFRIVARGEGGGARATPLGWFDAASDMMPEPPPKADPPRDELEALYDAAARRILELSGARQGWCLDVGCETGRLAAEIARRSELRVVGVCDDPARAAAARKALDAAGLQGVRVTIHEVASTELPYTDWFANLVVSERTLLSGILPDARRREIERVLRPAGGTACLGRPGLPGARGDDPALALAAAGVRAWSEAAGSDPWKPSIEDGAWLTLRRGRLPGSGEWSHLYADAGNTSSSGDELRDPVRIQWFGGPGPRNMIDRHHRALGPLSKDGRIFVHGNDRVLAIDAYNGTMLWDVGVPGSRRVAAMRDAGHVAASDDRVWIAAGESCVGLDVATGEPERVLRTPARADGSRPWWGWVACVGDRVFGSGQKPKASLSDLSKATLYEGSYFDERPVATSEAVHSVDPRSGDVAWEYRRAGGSAIANSTLAVAEGRVLFVESRSPAAVADPTGRVKLETLLAGDSAHLVALDAASGAAIWDRPVDLAALRHVLFVCAARGKALLVGTRNEGRHPRYDLLAFDAATGEPAWSTHYVLENLPANGDHGEQDQHPVIVGDIVVSRPFAFDLRTGRKLPFALDRGGHGCGALTASSSYLFGRGGNPRIYPIDSGGASNRALTRSTRPGCWIHIIPAGGMVLIPEGSSGCTCDYPLQTSLGLIPWGSP